MLFRGLGIISFTEGVKSIFIEEMSKEKVHILPTDNSPEVYLNPDGIIKIKGRGMVVNKTRVPEQINDWLDEYLLNPAETTEVIIAFEYLNSYSKQFYNNFAETFTGCSTK